MPNSLSDNRNAGAFEQVIADALGPGSLPRFSTDEEFINSLWRNLNDTSPPRLPSYRIWMNGLSRGAVAAACGFILFTSLNILPSILVNTSVTGACLAQRNIVEFTWRSRIFWQQLVVNLENHMR
jgi:hypothetical protein